MTEGHAPTGDETVATARNARRRFHATLIGVAPYLEKPYTDDPRWTPWTRFVRPMIDMVDAAFASLLAARDAEKARADELSEALTVAIGKIVEIGRTGQQKIADEKVRADRAEAQVVALDRHTRANFVPFEAHDVWKGRALAAEAEVERLRSDLRAANTTIEEAFIEAEAERDAAYTAGFEQVRRRCEQAEAERDEWRQACREAENQWSASSGTASNYRNALGKAEAQVASLRAQLDAMGEAEVEYGIRCGALVWPEWVESVESGGIRVQQTVRRSPWTPVESESGD